MKSKSLFVVMGVVVFIAAQAVQGLTLTGTEHADISTGLGGGGNLYQYDFSTADIRPNGNLYAAYIYDQAELSFNGGWTEQVYAHNSSGVNMFSGETTSLVGYGTSTLNLYGGYVGIAGNGGGLSVFDYSTVNISGGTVGGMGKGSLHAQNSSTVNISENGYIRELYAYDTSFLNISGGSIGEVLNANENSSINISGGDLPSGLDAYDFSEVTISGQFSSDHLNAYNSSQITFEGFDFAIDGVPVPYGVYYASDYDDGVITGTLNNNGQLFNHFSIYDNASIILTPEPTTLLLLGLGGLIFRKRR